MNDTDASSGWGMMHAILGGSSESDRTDLYPDQVEQENIILADLQFF